MEVTGTLLNILPEVTGESSKGPWVKRDIIVETEGQHPKKVCITIFGTKVSLDGIGIGQNVTCHIDLDSREHNGRWYTNVTAWKIDGARSSGPREEAKYADPEPPFVPEGVVASDTDDLPF
jgi:hypothetical protein